jgi:hypothetical protein
MTITIKLKTDNAAFSDDYHGEVTTIIRAAALKVAVGERAFNLHDSNGNTVGTVKVTGR